MGIGLNYGLYTEHPGPIITNGMGPVPGVLSLNTVLLLPVLLQCY